MAKKKIINEQDSLYLLKMILAKMSFDVAKNMMVDLKDPDKRTPALYNSCIKFLESNEITFDKIATSKDDEGLTLLLNDANNSFDAMLIEYDSFGETNN